MSQETRNSSTGLALADAGVLLPISKVRPLAALLQELAVVERAVALGGWVGTALHHQNALLAVNGFLQQAGTCRVAATQSHPLHYLGPPALPIVLHVHISCAFTRSTKDAQEAHDLQAGVCGGRFVPHQSLPAQADDILPRPVAWKSKVLQEITSTTCAKRYLQQINKTRLGTFPPSCFVRTGQIPHRSLDCDCPHCPEHRRRLCLRQPAKTDPRQSGVEARFAVMPSTASEAEANKHVTRSTSTYMFNIPSLEQLIYFINLSKQKTSSAQSGQCYQYGTFW